MDAYSGLYIADRPVAIFENYISPEVLTIFREMDKIVDDQERAYLYLATAQTIKDRLNVMGYSLKRVKEEFDSSKSKLYTEEEEQLKRWQERIEEGYKDWSRLVPTLGYRELEEKVEVLRETTFEEWVSAYAEILSNRIVTRPGLYTEETFPYKEEIAGLSPLIRYIITDNHYLAYTFPHNDIRSFLRVALEECPNDSIVAQDLTELVVAGYYKPDEPVCENAIQSLAADYSVNGRIVILGEGSSDIEILDRSLRLLFPHL
jgi:hypothetical protein